MYQPNQRQLDQIAQTFTFHPPKPGQADRYERIRAACGELATLFVSLAPESRELSLALTKVQEAQMLAIAAIACNE